MNAKELRAKYGRQIDLAFLNNRAPIAVDVTDLGSLLDSADYEESLRAKLVAADVRGRALNERLEGLLNRIGAAEDELRALRAVPTPEASGVCVDDDCPFPEHTGDCPPASPQQWEHLARLRGRHIEYCHQRMMTAREERDDAMRTLVDIKKSYVEQLSRVSVAAQTNSGAWKNRAEAAEYELTQAKTRLGQAQDAKVEEHARFQRLEKRLETVKEDRDHFAKGLSKEQDISEGLARKLDGIRGLLA